MIDLNKKKLEEAQQPRDWVDVVGKVFIPLAIAVVAGLYTLSTHYSEKDRLQFDRETAWLQKLSSSDEGERLTAITLIKSEDTKSAAMLIVLTKLCKTTGSLSQAARSALNDSQQKECGDSEASIAVAKGASAPKSGIAKISVFVEVARPEQVVNATALQAQLQKSGYDTPQALPEIANASVATVHTYVRFFSAPSAAEAGRVAHIMSDMGYKSVGVQDFSAYAEKPLSFVEVWIGSTSGELK